MEVLLISAGMRVPLFQSNDIEQISLFLDRNRSRYPANCLSVDFGHRDGDAYDVPALNTREFLVA